MFRPKTRLHALLDKARLSQRMLAEELGVDAPSVSSWIGLKRMPRKDTLENMARLMQLDVDHLTAEFVAGDIQQRYSPTVCKLSAKILEQVEQDAQ